jgi:hypothetical protein
VYDIIFWECNSMSTEAVSGSTSTTEMVPFILMLPDDPMGKIFHEVVNLSETNKEYVHFAEVCKRFYTIQCTHEGSYRPKVYRIIVHALKLPMDNLNLLAKEVQAVYSKRSSISSNQLIELMTPLKEQSHEQLKYFYDGMLKEVANEKNASLDFESYYKTALVMLRVNGTSKTLEIHFRSLCYEGMMKAFVNQPLANITPSSFMDQRDQLVDCHGGDLTDSAIESQLRLKLTTPERLKEFDSIIDEFQNAAVDSPRFIETKNAIQDLLESKKVELELELHKLLGENGLKEIKTLSQEIEKLRIQIFDAADNRDENKHSELMKSNNELKSKYNSLLAKLNKIGKFEFKNGELYAVSGPLFEVDKRLTKEGLLDTTRAEMQTMADFYRELKTDITPTDDDDDITHEKTRSEALDRILGASCIACNNIYYSFGASESNS